jgi:transposase-like protein
MNLLELFRRFQDNDQAIAYLEAIRWQGKVTCPYCESNKTCKHHVTTGGRERKRWQCWNCHRPFAVTVGTIFHRTHIPLNKWFWLISLMLNAKKGLSACQASRDLGMNRPTVWSMMHRIRKAMATDQAELLKGIVEMDECYVGGKPRKGDYDDDDKPKRGRGTKKEAVIGAVEREGNVKIQTVSKSMLNAHGLMAFVRKHVHANATLMTDEYTAYSKMKDIVKHETINHSYEYVRGNIHTNTIESFWAILKRGIIGQYHKVSKQYLPMYLDEFEYRYNRRKQDSDVTFEDLLGRMCYAK